MQVFCCRALQGREAWDLGRHMDAIWRQQLDTNWFLYAGKRDERPSGDLQTSHTDSLGFSHVPRLSLMPFHTVFEEDIFDHDLQQIAILLSEKFQLWAIAAWSQCLKKPQVMWPSET